MDLIAQNPSKKLFPFLSQLSEEKIHLWMLNCSPYLTHVSKGCADTEITILLLISLLLPLSLLSLLLLLPSLLFMYQYYFLCAADIDECRTGDNKCHSDANCLNSIGSYTCQCKPGYQGSGVICKCKYMYFYNSCVNADVKDKKISGTLLFSLYPWSLLESLTTQWNPLLNLSYTENLKYCRKNRRHQGSKLHGILTF